MTKLLATRALLADGWASDVRLRIAAGRIAAIETGVRPQRDELSVGSVIPGLCNAHSHAFQRALVGRTEYRKAGSGEDSFWSWRRLMYALAAQLNDDLLLAIAAQVYAEMVSAGYTSVVEFHYLHGGSSESANGRRDALIAAAERAGIRLIYVPVLYERAGFDESSLAAEQRPFELTLDRFLAHVDAAGTVVNTPHRVGIGVHSLRAVSKESLDAVADAAARWSLPLHVHVAEQPREVDECVAAHGVRPVRWLLDNYPVDAKWTMVHATHMDDDEIRALAESGATVCLCPSTEGNLGDGVFPLGDFLHGGGSFAIGSDSHVSLDPFEELRWLEYGQRLITGRRNVAAAGGLSTGETLFLRALEGGKRAAGASLDDAEMQGLAVGARADLVSLDDRDPLLAGHGSESLMDALVFSGMSSPIHRVMIDGRWCVSGGKHRDREDIAKAYGAALGALPLRRN